jgi:hypothetical protein
VFASDPGTAADGGGRVVVAARDTFNSLWAGVADPRTGSWSRWEFGGGVVKGTPAVAFSASGSPTAYIAVRDAWNSYWLARYVPGGTFGGWTHLAGVFSTDPAMTSCPDGSIYVVGRDNWNSLWSLRYVPGLGAQSWQWGMGLIQGNPSIACGASGMVFVAARDAYNALWMARISGNSWQGWRFIGGVLNSDPQIAAGAAGAMRIAFRDNGGGVWLTSFAEDLPGVANPSLVGGVLQEAAPATAQGALSIMGRDTSNHLWRFDAGMSQWLAFGQPAAAAGPLITAPR